MSQQVRIRKIKCTTTKRDDHRSDPDRRTPSGRILPY